MGKKDCDKWQWRLFNPNAPKIMGKWQPDTWQWRLVNPNVHKFMGNGNPIRGSGVWSIQTHREEWGKTIRCM
jgi:hypothetical protein